MAKTKASDRREVLRMAGNIAGGIAGGLMAASLGGTNRVRELELEIVHISVGMANKIAACVPDDEGGE